MPGTSGAIRLEKRLGEGAWVVFMPKSHSWMLKCKMCRPVGRKWNFDVLSALVAYWAEHSAIPSHVEAGKNYPQVLESRRAHSKRQDRLVAEILKANPIYTTRGEALGPPPTAVVDFGNP